MNAYQKKCINLSNNFFLKVFTIKCWTKLYNKYDLHPLSLVFAVELQFISLKLTIQNNCTILKIINILEYIHDYKIMNK